MLYTDTCFSQAIFKLFDGLDKRLKQAHPNLSDKAIKAYLFGGCAVHLYTGSRATNDVDVAFKGNTLLLKEISINNTYFKNEEGLRKTLLFDKNFDISLAPIDPAYEDRASLLPTKTNLVSVYSVSPVDIAVSKLGRFEENDRRDIKILYTKGLFSIEQFKDVAYEAHSYCGVAPDKLIFNITEAEKMLREISR